MRHGLRKRSLPHIHEGWGVHFNTDAAQEVHGAEVYYVFCLNHLWVIQPQSRTPWH